MQDNNIKKLLGGKIGSSVEWVGLHNSLLRLFQVNKQI